MIRMFELIIFLGKFESEGLMSFEKCDNYLISPRKNKYQFIHFFSEQEPPQSLLKLNLIADKERGWLMVVKALIETVIFHTFQMLIQKLFFNLLLFQVPDNDSLGPAVITLFLDECPLPSKV